MFIELSLFDVISLDEDGVLDGLTLLKLLFILFNFSFIFSSRRPTLMQLLIILFLITSWDETALCNLITFLDTKSEIFLFFLKGLLLSFIFLSVDSSNKLSKFFASIISPFTSIFLFLE